MPLPVKPTRAELLGPKLTAVTFRMVTDAAQLAAAPRIPTTQSALGCARGLPSA